MLLVVQKFCLFQLFKSLSSCLWPYYTLAAIYDVDEEEEKLDLEPEFQYIPESCGLDRSHSEPDGWKSSFQMLKEGLSTGSVLAQFDVSHPEHIHMLSNLLPYINVAVMSSYIKTLFC